ncbi:hypothetical protein [uncultured Tenacibaculum sp.]|uniref:hypothetical protein n=1 Tax=uncultured Tenacibaculum sp. TaxID=174713 RepID=UPI002639F60A|nr:hypothetical protein [uncultured Tenacibaculum sp.]
MKKSIIYCFLFISLFSCKKEPHRIQFYHWKSNAVLSSVEKETLEELKSEKTFMHYFDVVLEDDDIHPVGVIQDIDPYFKTKEVVPVVFIANDVFKSRYLYSIDSFVADVEKLIQQIHERYFEKEAVEIQIDCDWTKSTQEKYFKFLEKLKEKFTLSATIRLHQVKYKKETGIPPVDYGTLMLYNVGDLGKFEENSILSSKIVQQYINDRSTYPLQLDLALPLFSQVVIKNNENNIRLINRVIEEDFKKDTIHFKNVGKNQFKVIKKTLYKGHYLYKDFMIKLEKTNSDEIVICNDLVRNSNLNIRNTILYHLDETEIQEQNFKKLRTRL